ncbi:protein of unknown function [Pseudomonas mediterranea]
MIVRPVRSSDLPALIALARSTGTGLTTLPANEERLAHRVGWAEKTFAVKPGVAMRTTCSCSKTTTAKWWASPPLPVPWACVSPGTTSASA